MSCRLVERKIEKDDECLLICGEIARRKEI
jgi:hypothetical protein